MRAFIAIEVTDEVRGALAEAQQELSASPAKVKWVAPENIHLTLKFLGNVSEDAEPQVEAAMGQAAGDGPFEFAVEDLGRFPPRGKPRVVWAGVSQGAEAVTAVQATLEAALRPLGFEKERRFVPHLTRGRVMAPGGADALGTMLAGRPGERFGVCTASEIVLFESALTPRGAVYRVLARRAL